jgi:hypothetical protein
MIGVLVLGEVLYVTRCRWSSANCCWGISIAFGRHSAPTGITGIYFPAIFVLVAHAAQEYVLVTPSASCRSENTEAGAWEAALAVADIVEGDLGWCTKMCLACCSLHCQLEQFVYACRLCM